MVPESLSEQALDLLNAALLGTGPGCGLLVVGNPPTGSMFVRVGDDERWLDEDEANAFMAALSELLYLGMVAPAAPDGSPSECLVTHLGRQTARRSAGKNSDSLPEA